MPEKKSFWTTLPGVVTAITGLITALVALIAALYPTGLIGQDTPRDGVRRDNIKGQVLSIKAPEWVKEPIHGSITFNKTEEINQIGEVKAYLELRPEGGWEKYVKSDPKTLVKLHSGEKLCEIKNAADNGANFYLGFQSHCNKEDMNTCRYQWEDRTLWVTIVDVEVVLAAKNRNCPDL